jgi:hypothetical protein
MTPTEWALLSQKERASWVVENLGAGHTGNLKQATTEVLMKLVHGSIKELQRRWEESQENTLAAAKAIWPDLRKALGQKARRIGRNGFAEPLVTEWANQPVVPTEGWSGRKPKTRATRFALAANAQSCGRLFNAHNFVWRKGDLFLHGKGATPAWKDDTGRPLLGLIPLNMASPILIVAGSDNARYLSFAPHGAGRNRSRTATIRSFADPKEMQRTYAETTRGIDVRWYSGKMDFSESPVGYKNVKKVKSEIQQFGLATVIGEIQPLGCIMAGEQPEPFWKKKKK